MLSKEDNDLLTQTGKGTPCGELMRRYWLPIGLSEEIVQEGEPLPVRLLGEELVAFRDGQGKLGLLGRRCSHRGADLAYGQVQADGLRCYYHGWLYDCAGKCLDQPLEPADSDLKDEIQHLAYPCTEMGGLVFGYLGGDEPPLLPRYEFLTVADEKRRAARYLIECNYLQAAEASVDPIQLMMFRQVFGGARGEEFKTMADGLQVESELTDFGLRLFALRQEAGSQDLEIRDFMMPFISTMSGVGIDGYTVHWHVPIDDTHHWRYVFVFRRNGPLSDEDARRNGVEKVEGYRLSADLKNREDEPSFVAYAVALAESQGPISDRTQEHLTRTDEGLIAMRNVVHKAIHDVIEGADPVHVIRNEADNSFDHIEGVETPVPAGTKWRDASGKTKPPSR